MLKKICGLFLGLVVLAGSACVTPTHASSASSVLITHIQATGLSGAKEELVVIHNNSSNAIDITGWCLTNKANVSFACFTAQSSVDADRYYVLPPYQSATIASNEYSAFHGDIPEAYSFVFAVTNQSSGSIVSNADTISLLDAQQNVVDSKTWTSPIPSPKWVSRVKLLSGPDIYASGNDTNDWIVTTAASAPSSGIELHVVLREQNDDNPPDSEPGEEPEEEPEQPQPTENPSTPSGEVSLPDIIITEIFPNAIGSDMGNEFIELQNTNDTQSFSLDGLKLRIGTDTAKWYTLPGNISIPAGGYIVFTDAVLGFTLVNTQGAVQLYMGDIPLTDRIDYSSPKDGEAWALFGDSWGYTKSPSPGLANTIELIVGETYDEPATSTQKPCAANQFRNPETGRCKLLATTASTPAACKPGQERNPETNRCKAAATTQGPAPCKEGQERNPETNRCRNIVKMSSADYGVKGIQTKASAQLSWYYWVAIIGIVAMIIGYAVWEWRLELRGLWAKAMHFLRRDKTRLY